MAIKYLAETFPEFKINHRPLEWQEKGLQQTRTGYGMRLTSRWCLMLPDKRMRRIYITQISNAGSAWVMVRGERYYLRDMDFPTND